MFTGIITGMGTVVSLEKTGRGAVLSLKAGLAGVEIGDSISINGTCLTVTKTSAGILTFDLSEETLKSTDAASLKPGDRVNLEPSLSAGGKLGGHFVTGHVDAVGSIRKKTKEGNAYKIEISAPPEVLGLLVKKGSVAVDGISLTVVDVLNNGFTVVIIPHTTDITTIGFKGTGSRVNLETDILGKYVLRLLGRKDGSVQSSLMEKLFEGGFAREK